MLQWMLICLLHMESKPQKHAAFISVRQMTQMLTEKSSRVKLSSIQSSEFSFFGCLLITVWSLIVKLQLMRWDIKQHRFHWVSVRGWRCCGDAVTQGVSPEWKQRLPTAGCHTASSWRPQALKNLTSLSQCVCVCVRCCLYLKPV